jgi:PKD repeat protein
VTIAYAENANAGPDQDKCGTLVATLAGNTPTVGSGAWAKVSGPGTVTFAPSAATPGATATVSAYGTYVLSWTITNGTCNNSDNVTIAYAENANAGPDQDKCGTLVATLAGNTPSAGSGAWAKVSGPGTVTFAPSASTPGATATVSAYGTYVLSWTITNGTCNNSDNVTIAYAENANAGPDQDKCGTLVATLAGNTPTVGSGAWAKVSGPGTVTFAPSAATPGATATVSAYGTYVLSWTITNGTCNNSDNVTIAYAENANAGPDQDKCGTLVATLAGNTPSAGSGAWAKVSGPGTVTFAPSAATPGATATVSAYGTYVLSWTITNGSCNTPDNITVTYEIAASAGPAQDLCNTLATAMAGNTPAVGTGTWTMVSGPGTVAFTPTVNTPTATATVSVYGTYVFNWTIDNGGVCSTNQDVTINYNPAGQVDQPANQELCNGQNTSAVNFTTTNTIGTTNYSWTNSAPSIGLAANGTGNIASFTAVNAGTAPVVATIVVTPTLVNGPANCIGSTKTFTITVNPTPTLSSTLTPADVCSHILFSYSPTSATTGTTFNWSRGVVAGITPAGPTSGTNNPNETLYNITGSPLAVTYEYTLAANSCSNVQNVIVNIKPEPVGADDTDNACSDESFDYDLQANIDAGNAVSSDFSWVAADNLNVTGESLLAQAGDVIDDIITNTSGSNQDVVYTVTPTGTNGCIGSAFTVTVTIEAKPAGTDDTDVTCSNVALNYDLQANVTATNGVTADFSWVAANNPNVSGESTTDQSGDFIIDNITNQTGSDQTVVYTVTPTSTAAGCEGDPFTITVTVRPEPLLTIGLTEIVCSHVAANRSLSITNGLPGTTYQWAAPDNTGGMTGGTAGGPGASGPITDVFQNLTGSNQTATYHVIPTSGAGCAGPSRDVVITVKPYPLTSAITGDATLCVGETNKIYEVTNTTGSSYNWSVPAGMIMTFDNDLYFIVAKATAAGSGNVQVIETNASNCVGPAITFPVTVSSYPTPETVSGPAVVCLGETGVTYSVTDHAGSDYTWTVPPGVTITSPDSLNEIEVTFNLNSTGNFTVVETNSAGCTTSHNPLSVNVNDVSGGTIAGNQAVCSGGDPSALTSTVNGSGDGTITYQWQDSPDNIIFNNIAGATASTYDPAGPLAQTTYYRRTAISTLGGVPCSAVSNVVTVTRNTVNAGVISADQTICMGGNPDALTSVLDGTGGGTITYRWVSGTDGATWALIGGATQVTYDPPSLVVTTYYKRVTISTLSGTPCTDTSNIVTMTINHVTGGTVAADQTICSGGDPAILTSTSDGSGDGVLTYQWQSSTDNVVFADLVGQTATTYDPGVSTQTKYYRRIITSTLNGRACTEQSNVVTITVNAVSGGTIGSNQTVCSAGDPALLTSVVAGTGSGTISYQWQDSPDNFTFTNIGGATASTYDPGAIAVTTYYKRITTSTLNAVPCSAESNVITVTVNDVLGGAVAADQTICSGGDPAAFTSTTDGSGDGTITYQWQSSTDNVTFTDITGATNATYDEGVLTQTTYYKRITTSTLNSKACSAASNTITVTVNDVDAGIVAGDQTICNGDNPSAFTSTLAGSGDGTITYRWQSSADNITFTNISGATASTYDPPVLTQTTYYRRVTTSTLNSKACTAISNVLTVTVNDVAGGSIAGDQTICTGEDPAELTNVSAGSGDGTITYQWQSSTNSITFTDIAGATSITYDPGVHTLTRFYRRVTISTLNGKECYAITNYITIAVNNVDGGAIANDQTICKGDAPETFTSTVDGSGGGVITYQWQSSTDNITYTDIPGADQSTYNASGISQVMYFKRITISTLNGTQCSELSNIISINVRERPAITGQPQDSTICENSSASFSVNPGVTNTPSYQWQVSMDNGATFDDVSGFRYSGQNSPVLNISGATSDMDGFMYHVILSGACPPDDTSEAATLTVLDRPEITTHPANTGACEDGTTWFTVDAGVTEAPAYVWQVDEGNSIFTDIDASTYPTNYSGQGTDSISVSGLISAMDGYLYRVIVSGTCQPAVTSNEALLTIREKPEITTEPFDTTVCEGTGAAFIINAGVTASPSYVWQVSVNGGTSWSTVSGAPYSGEASQMLYISSATSAMNGYLYRAIVNGTCTPADTSIVAMLSINEKPEILVNPVDTTGCEDGNAAFFINAGVTTNPSFQWEVDKGSGFAGISDDATYSGTDNDTLTITGITSGMHGYRYRIIVSGTCAPDKTSSPADLFVYEKPEITVHPANKTICEDDGTSFAVEAGKTTAPAYQWEVSTDNGSTWNNVPGIAPYSGTTTSTLEISNATSVMHLYQYRVVISGTCTPPVTSSPAILTVNEKPEISLQPQDSTICENDGASFTVAAGNTTSPVYQWQVDQGTGFNNAGGVNYSGVTSATLMVSNATSAMNGYRYRVVIGGTCTPSVISDTVTLAVNDRPEVVLQPQDVTICEDGNTLFRVSAGVTDNPTYQWEVNNSGSWIAITNGSVYSGADDDTLIITGTSSSLHNNLYRVVISGACTPTATSEDARLTINEKPEIISQPEDSTICEGSSATFTVDAGVTTNPSYQWQVDQGTGVFTNVSGGFYTGQISATLRVSNTVSSLNGYRYRVIITGTCTPADTSEAATLTILEKPEVITSPSNAENCEEDQTFFKVDAGVTTAPVYQWQVSEGGAPYIDVASSTYPAKYSGASTDSLVISDLISDMTGYIYRAVITGACAPTAYSGPAFLVVNEKPEILAHPVDSTICENANAAFTVDAGVTTSAAYQWQINTGTGGFTNLSDAGKYLGATTASLSVFNGTANMNGYLFRVIVSGKCSPSVISDTATLTVYTRPVITADLKSALICAGGDTSFSITATGSLITYQWQVDEGSGLTNLTDGGKYSGSATATLTINGAEASDHNNKYRVLVTGACTPTVSSSLGVLTIYQSPQITDQPDNSTICEYNTTNFAVTATGNNLAYQWQEFNGSSWSDLDESGDFLGTNTSNLSVYNSDSAKTGYQYRVIVSGYCSPAVTSQAAILTVNTSPLLVTSPTDTTICAEQTAHFIVGAVGSGLTYQWQEDRGSGFVNLPESGNYSGTKAATLNVANLTTIMTGYRYRVRIGGTCPPAVTSGFAMLVVNSLPEFVTQPEDAEICEEGTTNFRSSATGTGVTYRWQVDEGSGFTDISDNETYNGGITTVLTVSDAPVSLNGNRYRLNVIATCATVSSEEVLLTINANPVATILGDGTYPLVCGGNQLTLDGNPSGGSGSYIAHTWSGDIGPLSSVNTRTTVFESKANGTYNLVYKVTDSKGCATTATAAITNDRPGAQFISDATPSCGTITVNFTNMSEGAATYEWNFDDPENPAISTEENPSHDFSNFTSQVYYYTVEMIARSANNCADTATEIVTVYPSIDATFITVPSEGCNPLTVVMETTPGGESYDWDYGDGNAESGNFVLSHTYTNTTGDAVTYTASLTTTSFYGCLDTKTMEITVYPLPTTNFSVDPVMQTYPDATVTFTNLTPQGSWTYEWDFGDGNTSVEESPVHVYADPNVYEVSLKALAGQCSDSISHPVTINPAIPIAAFEVPAPDCAPLTHTFVNNSQYATSYEWDFKELGTKRFEKNPEITFPSPGIYQVTLTVYGPGGSDRISELITVKLTPTAYANIAPPRVFIGSNVTTFNLSSDTLNPKYAWDWGDGTPVDTTYKPGHVYEESGKYTVTLTVTNDNACSHSYSYKYIEVEPGGEIRFPTAFRPNPDAPADPTRKPGDASNEVFFPGIYQQVREYQLTIYNRWGEQIFQTTDINTGWNGWIYGNKKPAEQGVYIWVVKGKYLNGQPFSDAGDITLLR